MKVISNDRSGEKVFALIYGASGTGKTDLCGQLGEFGQVLVIDIDCGSMTLRNSPRVAKGRDNLVVVSFDAFQDLNSAYQYLQKNDPAEWTKLFNKGVKNPEDLVKITKPFDWVIWDSWTELQWQMLQKLRKDKDMLTTSLDFRKNLEIQHWGMLTDLNKLSVESLREVPVNQIFIMLETMTKDDVSGAIFGGPAIHGKLVNEMPGYFNIVVHTYTDPSGRFWATTKSKGKWPAKTRLMEGVDMMNPTPEAFFIKK